MTRIKIYDEDTVVFAKRVPKSKLKEVTNLVEEYLNKFKVSNEKLSNAKEQKTRIHRVALPIQHNGDSMLVYPCGCHRNKLFVREPTCNIREEEHKL